ncbi:MAG: undecaprenyl/decaprenyl-phosphate alpha-N-acetylglucosaminyl 1-phosphate transferase, partial [Victivallaceae bacterium]|nr:undecaprenyl/decaprenyl-phosphate alpha-N-acetylglucosaminyl 1-phosphate transferase [Victivallaceae bacterium]
MNLWHHLYVFVFTAGMILTLCLTPVFQKIAELTGFMDKPQDKGHKGHRQAIPLLGGAAMFCSWILVIALSWLALKTMSTDGMFSNLAGNIGGVKFVSIRLLIICSGAFGAMLLGLLDDRFGMSALMKFGGQFVIAAVVVIWGGVQISAFFTNPIIISVISIAWFMLLMNAINFFDNMDGLAVGTVTIAMALFAIVASINGQFFVATLGALTCGVGVGFWFFNHSPATIFMGDSGSHLLGYLTAVISSSVTFYSTAKSNSLLSILVPLFILAVPLFDTLAVVVIRLRAGNPIYIGDHNHISHRFVKMGMSRKHAVFMVHLLALLLGLSVLPVLWGDFKIALICII